MTMLTTAVEPRIRVAAVSGALNVMQERIRGNYSCGAQVIPGLLTIGDVRGFAFMLGLSTVLDVFTAYFFIRPMVILVGRRRTFTDARFLGIGRGLGARTAPGET